MNQRGFQGSTKFRFEFKNGIKSLLKCNSHFTTQFIDLSELENFEFVRNSSYSEFVTTWWSSITFPSTKVNIVSMLSTKNEQVRSNWIELLLVQKCKDCLIECWLLGIAYLNKRIISLVTRTQTHASLWEVFEEKWVKKEMKDDYLVCYIFSFSILILFIENSLPQLKKKIVLVWIWLFWIREFLVSIPSFFFFVHEMKFSQKGSENANIQQIHRKYSQKVAWFISSIQFRLYRLFFDKFTSVSKSRKISLIMARIRETYLQQ